MNVSKLESPSPDEGRERIDTYTITGLATSMARLEANGAEVEGEDKPGPADAQNYNATDVADEEEIDHNGGESIPTMGSASESRTGDGLGPCNVGFFELPLRQILNRKPYFLMSMEGKINLPGLVKDFKTRIFRLATDNDLKSQYSNSSVILEVDPEVFVWATMRWLRIYAFNEPKLLHWKQQLRKYSKKPRRRRSRPTFRLICTGHHGPDEHEVEIGWDNKMSDEQLQLNYGSEFLQFHGKFVRSLKDTKGGLSILRGAPGVGKTTYLRHLIAQLQKTHVVFYLSASHVPLLLEPQMVAFWARASKQHEPKSLVILIEDAEQTLLKRGPDNQSLVAGLLNVSDGLLGDFLKMHLIVTLNCDFRELDGALLRPGRLVALKEFMPLDRSQAVKVAQKIGIELPEKAAFTLAEIYRHSIVETDKTSVRRQMGFASN